MGSTSSRVVVTTWTGDGLQTGKPSRYITNTKVNSAFHPSGVGKSSSGHVSLGLSLGAFTCVEWRLALCDLMWQVMLRSSVMGFLLKATPFSLLPLRTF